MNMFLMPSLSCTLYWEIMPQHGMRALLLATFNTASSICGTQQSIRNAARCEEAA